MAVADPDEAGRRKAAQEAGAARSYADYREMLKKEALDIVSVCPRWVDCHEEMVLACVAAGCHVYCEKPIAADLASADRMVAAAERAGRKVAVAHQGVYLPQVQEVKRLLRDGRIGPVQAIYACGKQDRRGGGEDMMVLGTHLFNMMRFFARDVAWMTAHVTSAGREIGPEDIREANEPIGPVAGDCVESYFAFQNGVSGFFTSRADQPGGGRSFGMEIVGREGRICVRGGAGTEIAIYPYGAYLPEDASQRWEVLKVEKSPLNEGNRLAILDLIGAIEEDRGPISSARDARAALEMILGAYESQIRGARVRFPIADRTHPLERLRAGKEER
ncbi:MAG: hypothetical protein A3G75_07275 [Verrucomicrobia bacterium RIFCSPLOWO2_12_FULL_64_8]|nr:MAG: hypothetical protein A3G75_07275 [Verrucomicrobia bacterium RIFCSPLOWO2_12_FULL_64_8]